MSNINQRYFIKQFTNNNREEFNKDLFIRNEDDIIEDIKKVILSCERSRHFTLKVCQFKVIEDYDEVMSILYNYEENLLKNKPKKRDNIYDFVNLKTTDMKLLVVTYYIEASNKFEYIDVIIAVPRVINKYYFMISGNLYSSLYQVVETTYNNSTSNTSSKDNITLKTIFMPIKIYKNNVSLLTVDNHDVKCVFYTLRVFNKSFNSLKPFIARLGFYKCMEYLGVNYINIYKQLPKSDENNYVFERYGIYVSVPKYIFDNDCYVQSIVYGLIAGINKETTYTNIFSKYHWLKSLGEDFNNASVDKGISILDSLESIYDIKTRECIRLPEEDKNNIYAILRWMLREFYNLKAKDNLDVTTKRIRCSEYIASLYAMKLSTGLYRVINDRRKNITVDSIKKIIMIPPMYLISSITKCNLINYRNLVNDLDAASAIEYTIKGVSGIGNENAKSVPKIYRYIDPSEIGIFDLDHSPKSDPGMSGSICPLVQLHNLSFSDYSEPNFWEDEFNNLTKNYKALVGKKEVISLQKQLLNIDNEDLENIVEDSLETVRKLMSVIRFAEVEDAEDIQVIEIDNMDEEDIEL